jgi:beta-N-acetylhexosaminidase
MLMTAHVLYPAFDPDLPATLSPRIINNLLRQQLGFTGVVVSDDLEMGAIIRHGSVEQAAVDSLVAGADLLLVCQSPELAVQARNACLQALETGRLSQQRLVQATQRIAVLKKKRRRKQLAAREVIGSAAHQRLVEEIQRAGV